MVSWILAFMNREIRGLHEAAYLLAFFAFLSQVLALVRDRAFAHFFGAGPTLDAYFSAFKIPDLLFAFLTLFVSSFAVIPLLADRGGTNTKESRTLVGSILLSFGVASIAAAGILYFLIPIVAPLLFPGFSESTKASVVLLSQIMLVQPIFLGLSSVIASVVQASRKFILYALAPIFYNLGIIFGAIILYPQMGIAGLGWGVVLGALLHFLIQVLPLMFHREMFRPVLSSSAIADTLIVVRKSLPRALALSSNQALMLAIISITSLAAAGSVASVSFAFNLQSVPLSIIGVSYAAALFPSLAMLFSKGDHDTFVSEVWAAIRHIIFWTAPAIALMIVLRAHMVRVILGSGEFTWADTRLTAAILAGFVISLIAQAAILVFSRAYYAAQKEMVPIVVNVGIALVAGLSAYAGFLWFQHTPVLQYFVENLFRIEDIPGSGSVVIVLAYSLVMSVGAIVFAFVFARDFAFERRVFTTLFYSFSASILAAAAAYGTLQIFGPLLPTETFVGIFTQGLAAGVAGLLVWAAALYSLRSQEFAETVTVLFRLVRR